MYYKQLGGKAGPPGAVPVLTGYKFYTEIKVKSFITILMEVCNENLKK